MASKVYKKSKLKSANHDKSNSLAVLQMLYKKRNIIKNKQESFKAHVESITDFLQNGDISQINIAKITELELRFQRQMSVFQEYENIQESIECIMGPEHEQDDRESFENEFYHLTSLCKNIISKYYSEKVNPPVVTNQNQTENVASSVKSDLNSSIKLPQIQLPRFSGSYDNWMEFRDTFDSLINKNDSISHIQKYHYLRAALEGGAAQVIRSLEFSAANYTVAWDTLLKRYNNDNLLVSNHVKSIFNIPVLQVESASELRKMLDILSKHLQSLESLGQPVKHWDTLIIYILSGKLDKITAREWE